MKKLVAVFVVVLFITGLGNRLYGQKIEAQNTYEISGKAKRGTLGWVEYSNNQYLLTYVTKATEKLLKFQTYIFDNDFKYVDMKDLELDVEQAKTKYSWFKFNGELYSVMGNYVEPNLAGTLVLKKKKITYKYDWLLLGYHKEIEILEKVKPKTDDGRKLFYYSHAEDDVTGDIYVVCGLKATSADIKADNTNQFMQNKNFVVMKFNKDLELVKEIPVNFDYLYWPCITRVISNDAEDQNAPSISKFAVIFRPYNAGKKYTDPNMNNLRYVCVDNKMNLIDELTISGKVNEWTIDELIHDNSNGDVYLFGPAKSKEFTGVQLIKIAKNKVEYISTTNMDDFEAKLKTPPTQKKSPAYKGKKFEIANYYIASNGDFFVSGQNFDPSKEGNKFKDVLAFHFDNKGVLKAQYGVDTKESNKYAESAGAPQNFLVSSDGKTTYWMIRELKGIAAWNPKPLTYARLSKIDLNNAAVGDFIDIGKVEKADYYLDPKFPFLQTGGNNKLVFFGSDKSGKTIWFCRVALD